MRTALNWVKSVSNESISCKEIALISFLCGEGFLVLQICIPCFLLVCCTWTVEILRTHCPKREQCELGLKLDRVCANWPDMKYYGPFSDPKLDSVRKWRPQYSRLVSKRLKGCFALDLCGTRLILYLFQWDEKVCLFCLVYFSFLTPLN